MCIIFNKRFLSLKAKHKKELVNPELAVAYDHDKGEPSKLASDDDDYEEDEEEVFICFHSIFFRFDSSIIKKFCFHSIFFVYKIFHSLVNPAPATAGAAPPKNRPREASVL